MSPSVNLSGANPCSDWGFELGKSKLCLSLCIISGNSWGSNTLFPVVVTCFGNRFSVCSPDWPQTHKPPECWDYRSVLWYNTLTLQWLFDVYVVYTCMMHECTCAAVHTEARGICEKSLSLLILFLWSSVSCWIGRPTLQLCWPANPSYPLVFTPSSGVTGICGNTQLLHGWWDGSPCLLQVLFPAEPPL